MLYLIVSNFLTFVQCKDVNVPFRAATDNSFHDWLVYQLFYKLLFVYKKNQKIVKNVNLMSSSSVFYQYIQFSIIYDKDHEANSHI